MSASRVVLPVLNLEQNDNPLKKTVLKGCKNYTVQKIQPDTQTESGITFTITPPSQNTVIDRRIDIEYEVEILCAAGEAWIDGAWADTDGAALNATYNFADTNYNSMTDGSQFTVANSAGGDWTFAGANPTAAEISTGVNTTIGRIITAAKANFNESKVNSNSRVVKGLGNNIALRQLPISSVVDNISLNINGQHISTELKRIVHPLLQYTSPEYREECLKGVAHHPDMDRDYTGRFASTGKRFTAANELSVDSNGGRKGETPDGVHFASDNVSIHTAGGVLVPAAVGASSGASGSLRLKIREPLNISPLSLHYGEGMTNINQLQVQINFDEAKINRMLRYFNITAIKAVGAGANSPVAPTVKFVGTNTARALLRYYQPQDDIRIPNEIVLPYFNPVVYQSENKTLTQGLFTRGNGAAESLSNTSKIQFNNRRLNQIPDAVYIWAAPLHVNKTLLSADFFAQIQSINVTFGNQTGILSNHTAYQLLQIAQENGCDVSNEEERKNRGYCLKLVFGKDIPLDDNLSPGTRGDFSIQLEIDYGTVAATGTYTAYEMYMNAGHCIIAPNECRIQTGLLDVAENIRAEDMGDKYSDNHMLEGGNMFSGLKNFARKVPHYVHSGLKAGNDALALAQGVKSLVGGSPIGGSEIGGSAVGGSAVGGNMAMGRMMSRRKY